VPNGALMGANLMVHLRKNVGFTAPLPAGVSDAELSALLVRCRANLSGTPVHFHLQITSFAVPSGTAAGSEPFLFQSVPDLDHLRHGLWGRSRGWRDGAKLEQPRDGECDGPGRVRSAARLGGYPALTARCAAHDRDG